MLWTKCWSEGQSVFVEEEKLQWKRATHSTKWGLSSLVRCFPGSGVTPFLLDSLCGWLRAM